MYQKRAYKFRLYPNAKRQKTVEEMLVLSQRLYNKILEKSKCEYGKGKNPKINKSTLNRYMKAAASEDKTFLKLYSQTR